ncbi:hypothetical protein [Bradyrhizobium genosp. A]|uniref:hypothetical protein n=1 Tax=Bradyrhizobium genosp. A TaxID=83626 RepID=UPI003CF8CC9B
MTPSSLINHKQGRERLWEFLDDDAVKLCVITAPADYGKSTLCEWLYRNIAAGRRPASFVQLNSVLKPPEILKAILTDLSVAPERRNNMRACRPPAPVSQSLIQNVNIINSQDIRLDATSKVASENDHAAYHVDLFDAFVQDLVACVAVPSFVLVIDNYEKCDLPVREWTYKCLLKLAKLIPTIKIVFFCQEFKKENLELAVVTLSREYSLGPIVNPEEVYEWLREHGQSINDHVVNAVANAFDNFSAKPFVMTNALKILLPRRHAARLPLHEVPPT